MVSKNSLCVLSVTCVVFLAVSRTHFEKQSERKKRELMAEMKSMVIEGAKKNKVDVSIAEKFWKDSKDLPTMPLINLMPLLCDDLVPDGLSKSSLPCSIYGRSDDE